MTTGAVWLSLIVAVLIVGALAKKKGTLVGGLLVKGKNGQLLLKLTPVPKGKRKKK